MISSYLAFKGSADQGQQLAGFFVGLSGGADDDVHAADLVDLIVLDLGEDQLLLDAQGIVAAAVEGVGADAAEVADTGQSHVEQTIQELPHLVAPQGDLGADGHALTQLEVSHGLLGDGDDGLLAGNLGQIINLNTDDLSYSKMLSEHFPDYVNNLQLRDSLGRILKLDKNGNGTFKNYVKEFIVAAANKAAAQGTDLSKHTYLVRDNKTGAIKDINWEAYNHFVSRSKAPGAFDSRANDTGENNLFGTSTTDNNHFTITAALHDSTANQDVYVENAKIVTMMNPMNYLGSPAATNARFYRIRYGTADSNTSVAIPLIVGTRAQNLGYRVDMATPFNVDHSGDYDLEELFNWMDNIVKNGR